MHNHEPSIKCPTYLKIEPEIQKLTESINQAKDVQEKAALALELQKEVKVLLECPDYKSATSAPRQTEGPSGHLPLGGDVDGVQCRNCHFLATLRKRTADVIIMAQKLA